MIEITYLNNDGGGFAEKMQIDDNRTIGSFMTEHVQGNATEYMIRVNRQEVSRDYILRQGDRISVTPTNIKGA